jgi:REP element-mobilizing transposase RayT
VCSLRHKFPRRILIDLRVSAGVGFVALASRRLFVAQVSRIRDRRYLPYWEVPKGVYFVTFRLADSLPEYVLQELRAKSPAGSPTKKIPEKLAKKFPAKEIEKMLDSGLGAKHLARAEIADLVEGALRAFDGVRYKLFAWCVMPNHVHVVFQPLGEWELARILHSWKSFTAHRVLRKFGIRGAFWQREYYDHLIRGGEEFSRAVEHVLENPRRAGLEGWRWVGVAPS